MPRAASMAKSFWVNWNYKAKKKGEDMVLECYEKYENFLELRMTRRREKKDAPGVNAVLLESREEVPS